MNFSNLDQNIQIFYMLHKNNQSKVNIDNIILLWYSKNIMDISYY